MLFVVVLFKVSNSRNKPILLQKISFVHISEVTDQFKKKKKQTRMELKGHLSTGRCRKITTNAIFHVLPSSQVSTLPAKAECHELCHHRRTLLLQDALRETVSPDWGLLQPLRVTSRLPANIARQKQPRLKVVAGRFPANIARKTNTAMI